MKYTQSKEGFDCPLANEGICQKDYKVKITNDLRKYTAPERVNAYLKEFFQLENVRYRTGKRAKVHFDIVSLSYNASKLASDCINTLLNQQQVP